MAMGELAKKLFRIGAVKCDGYYKLKLHEKRPNDPLSPIFLNLRTSDNPKPGLLTPEIVHDVAEIFYEYVIEDGIKFDFIAGIPNAADPFVKEFAKLFPGCEDKILYLNKEVEAEMRRIGCLKEESRRKIFPGAIVLLFDDLITKAESKLEAAHALEAEGLRVHDVVVLVDREQGGRDEMEKEGYILHAMVNISDLLLFYNVAKLISDEKFEEIKKYLAENG